MSDKPKIIAGLVVGAVVLTFPLWYAPAAGRPDSAPQYALPEGHCVEANMKAQHMQLLQSWRNAVVREGQTEYVSKSYGDKYRMRLTETCLLECHGLAANKKAASAAAGSVAAHPGQTAQQAFCYQCHSYAGVRPTCWDCHLESQEK